MHVARCLWPRQHHVLTAFVSGIVLEVTKDTVPVCLGLSFTFVDSTPPLFSLFSYLYMAPEFLATSVSQNRDCISLWPARNILLSVLAVTLKSGRLFVDLVYQSVSCANPGLSANTE